MNNEPVAWGWYDLEIKRFFPHWDEDLMENKEGCIPLYTHPAKELTDGEIQQISHRYHYTYNPDYIGFARAILRKVQEADKIESLGTVNIGGVHFKNGKEVK